MKKGYILVFPRKRDLGIVKNYRGILLTSIAAKIYNPLLRNFMEPKIEKILGKNQNGFRRHRSPKSQIWTILQIPEGVRAINLHHHHITLVARISLTLSRHSSLSFITLGRSSGQHPVSSHSC